MHHNWLWVLLGTVLYATPAQSWFFQPPPGTVADETLARFQEASVMALTGLTSVHRMLRQIEEGETSVNEVEVTTAAVESLSTAGSLFENLQTEDLKGLEVSLETVAFLDEAAVGLVAEAEIETAADLARYSSDQSRAIATLIEDLQERDFGPSSATDAEGRTIINRLVSSVASMVIVVNSVSGALALENAQ